MCSESCAISGFFHHLQSLVENTKLNLILSKVCQFWVIIIVVNLGIDRKFNCNYFE